MRCTKTAYILQCTDFLLQSAVNITAQFADMILYVATTVQFADVGFALLQILPDGKAPCNELMLHHAMQCTGASWRSCKYRAILRQILRSLEILIANDQHMVHQYFHTEVLSQKQVFTHAFTHTHAFTQIPSCAGVFAQGCFFTKNFCTQMRGYLYI